MNRHVGNVPPMPDVFPDYPAPVVRNAVAEREMVMTHWARGGCKASLSRRSPTFAALRQHIGAAG
jgi:hypothetical protein